MESYNNIKNGCSKCSDCFNCPFDDCHISSNENMWTGRLEGVKAREQEVMHLLGKGLSFREVGKKMGYSKRHITRIKKKHRLDNV